MTLRDILSYLLAHCNDQVTVHTQLDSAITGLTGDNIHGIGARKPVTEADLDAWLKMIATEEVRYRPHTNPIKRTGVSLLFCHSLETVIR